MRKIAVLDPGHGGRDPGAIGPTGLQEKTVTLLVAKGVAEILRGAGVDARLTRDSDKHFATSLSADLSARAKIANQAGADVFVSIHCNAVDNWSANGTETYHYPGSTEGKKLAGCLQRQLVPALGLRDRGVKEANFAVLRESAMPAALVELAFISNPLEEELLRSPEAQEKAAWAIAAGIGEYLGVDVTPPATNIFNDVVDDGTETSKAIKWCKNQGLLKGDERGNFNPREPVTREQLALVLYRQEQKGR